jgi:hypothetical protein
MADSPVNPLRRKFGAARERAEREVEEIYGDPLDIKRPVIMARARLAYLCLTKHNPPFSSDEAHSFVSRHYFGLPRGNTTTDRIANGGIDGETLRKANTWFSEMNAEDRKQLVEFVTNFIS